MGNIPNSALEAYMEAMEEAKQILSSVWKRIIHKSK